MRVFPFIARFVIEAWQGSTSLYWLLTYPNVPRSGCYCVGAARKSGSKFHFVNHSVKHFGQSLGGLKQDCVIGGVIMPYLRTNTDKPGGHGWSSLLRQVEYVVCLSTFGYIRGTLPRTARCWNQCPLLESNFHDKLFISNRPKFLLKLPATCTVSCSP